MAKEEESRNEFRFTGSHDETKATPLEKTPTAPSPEVARMVALSVLDGHRGKYRPVPHFGKRMRERMFTIFDVTYVIRNGNCMEAGEYCEGYKNFKYTFRGDVEGARFDAVFAISAEHDISSCPLVILITGCWKNSTGKRSKTF